MVECKTCKQEMLDPDTKSCTHQFIKIGGKWHLRNNKYFDDGPRCHDCGITNGFPNYHHPGCDMERCPVCGGQAIGCDCDYDDLIAYSDPCPECGGLVFLPNEQHGTLFCMDCGTVVVDAGSLAGLLSLKKEDRNRMLGLPKDDEVFDE